jgi:group II intron reverse transcriptase/maturase
MFKNILEPICEKEFHPNSFGFRPHRSTEHAISLNNNFINRGKLHFCVDIDIKGFFDNIHHNKLIKQCMTIGIKDRKVLSIIKAMLKAPIHHPNGEIENPTKGTPQGGILSPLLANICLNEMDWWVDKQWNGMKTRRKYSSMSKKWRALKNTDLTEVKLVRYADDFKLMCRTHKDAIKMFKITKQFLKHRLKLDISPNKSKVINLRKKSSEFLGFSIKAKLKGKGDGNTDRRVAQLNISKKSKAKIREKLKTTLIKIQKENKQRTKNIILYNSQVRGIQNYYRIAANISADLSEIGFHIDKIIHNRLSKISKLNIKDEKYKKRYKGYHFNTWTIKDITLFTIQACKKKDPMQFSQRKADEKETNKQFEVKTFSENIEKLYDQIAYKDYEGNTEWELLRIQAYEKTKGICLISKEYVNFNEFDVHHIIPREYGGKDELSNLIILKKEIHKELHKKNPSITGNKTFDKLRNVILNLM